MINFYDWMIKKYDKKDTWRGDLARDIMGDENFPKDGTRNEILSHLENKHACSECLEVFKRCWRDYERTRN